MDKNTLANIVFGLAVVLVVSNVWWWTNYNNLNDYKYIEGERDYDLTVRMGAVKDGCTKINLQSYLGNWVVYDHSMPRFIEGDGYVAVPTGSLIEVFGNRSFDGNVQNKLFEFGIGWRC